MSNKKYVESTTKYILEYKMSPKKVDAFLEEIYNKYEKEIGLEKKKFIFLVKQQLEIRK